jgi:uncharacterized protein YjiS (DUF1127 family)
MAMATHAMTSQGIERSTGRSRGISGLVGWFDDVASKLSKSWAWYRDYQNTVRELRSLSEKELNDIGIARCDIATIAMQSANATHDAR